MQALPPEVVCIILSYTSLHDALIFSATNKAFREFISHLPDLWSPRIASVFPLHKGLHVAIAEAKHRLAMGIESYRGINYIKFLSALLSGELATERRLCNSATARDEQCQNEAPRTVSHIGRHVLSWNATNGALGPLVNKYRFLSSATGSMATIIGTEAAESSTSTSNQTIAKGWSLLGPLKALLRLAPISAKKPIPTFLVMGLNGSGKHKICHSLFRFDRQWPIGENRRRPSENQFPPTNDSTTTPLANISLLTHMVLEVVDLGQVHPSFLIGRARKQACKGMIFVVEEGLGFNNALRALAECCRANFFPVTIPLLILLQPNRTTCAAVVADASNGNKPYSTFTPERFLFQLISTQRCDDCFDWDPLIAHRKATSSALAVSDPNLQFTSSSSIWQARVEDLRSYFCTSDPNIIPSLPPWALSMDILTYCSILFGGRKWQIRSLSNNGAVEGLEWLLAAAGHGVN